jgi:hypothetical protein
MRSLAFGFPPSRKEPTLRIPLATLAVLLALPTCAYATSITLDDEGNVVSTSELDKYAPPLDTPDADGIPISDGLAHAAAGKVRRAKRKTTRAYGEVLNVYGELVVSAFIEATWHRDRWRILQPVGAINGHTIGKGWPKTAWSAEPWSSWDKYEYQFKGHGMGSGYVVRRIANFKGCTPLKVLCFSNRTIDLRLNLHADGTFKRIVHVTS